MFTDEELDEVAERTIAELSAQGLTAAITDTSALAPIARDLNDLDTPVDVDSLGVEDLDPVRRQHRDRRDERAQVSAAAV